MKFKGKKILFVGNSAWSMFNFRLAVMKSLQRDGAQIIVLAPEDKYVDLIRAEGLQFLSIIVDNKGKSIVQDLKLLYRLKAIYTELNPDFIFHFTIKLNIFGSLAAGLCRIDNVAFVTGAGHVFRKRNLLTLFVERLFRFSLRFSREVWFLNSDDCNLFVTRKMVSRTKTRILPGEGIDTVHFNTEITLNKEFRSFLFLGRLLWDKGVGLFADAARILRKEFPNVEFRILGFLDCDNPEAVSAGELHAWVSQGIVSYLGETSNVSSFIEQTDCVVLPSHYREGIPRTLLEAAALKRPIITTDNVGCREVVQDGVNGYLCKMEDLPDLINKMRQMILLSYENRLTFGLNSRLKACEEFENKIIEDVYKAAMLQYLSSR